MERWERWQKKEDRVNTQRERRQRELKWEETVSVIGAESTSKARADEYRKQAWNESLPRSERFAVEAAIAEEKIFLLRSQHTRKDHRRMIHNFDAVIEAWEKHKEEANKGTLKLWGDQDVKEDVVRNTVGSENGIKESHKYSGGEQG